MQAGESTSLQGTPTHPSCAQAHSRPHLPAPNPGNLPTQIQRSIMKLPSLSSSLAMSAALLLLMPGCESGDKSTSSQKVPAITPGAGVVTRPSGLRYQVLASGPADGKSPGINDSVTVHYRGTLTNGTQFDSSYDRGAPTTFGVGQVIPGWTEALQLMKPGDQWVIFVPASLGYGPRAMGSIPANSDLIFQVQLLKVNGAQ